MTFALPRPSRWTIVTVAMAGALAVGLTVFAVVRFGSIPAALAYVSGERLIVDSPSKSFGTVDAGTRQFLGFSVMYRSGRPITLLGARSSCGCTVAGNLPVTIPDGEDRAIDVIVKTAGLSGDFAATIRLYSDDPTRRELALVVRGWILGKASVKDAVPPITGRS